VSRRAGRTDRTRAAAVMFGGWLLVAGLVLSYMSGTTHSYYSIALAPPIGALVGIGSFGLWRIRHTWFARAAMAVAIAVTAAWAWVLLGRSPGWFPWLRVTIVVAAAGAVGLILAGPVLRTATARSRMLLAAVPVALAAIAVLGGPLAYSLDTAASSYSGASPSAGPALTAAGGGPGGALGFGRGGFPGAGAGGRDGFGDFPGGLADGRTGRGGFAGARAGGGFAGIGGNATVSAALAKLLETDASHYKWVAATQTSDTAASMELASGGVPVMALGGFRGTDPALSLAGFEQLVSAHEIHYYVGGGGGFGGGGGGLGGAFAGRGLGDAADGPADGPADGAAEVPGRGAGGFGGGGGSDAAQIAAWVEAHFTPQTVGGVTVYNLTTPSSGS
jgi:hypothetical protein